MNPFNRRRLLKGVAGSGAYFLACGCSQAQPTAAGCEVADPRALADGNMSTFAFAADNVVRKSGIEHLDDDLAFALTTIRTAFSIDPGFAFYNDGQVGNATVSKESIVDGSKGTVLFGLKLLKDLLAKPDGDAAVVAVCAHEFAHILAYDTGLHDQLVPNLSRPFRGEQHADYLAGFFAGQRKLIHSDYPAIVFLQTLRSMAGGNHGTAEQRAEAVWTGFQAAHDEKISFNEGIQKGFDWAMKRKEV
ncbi:hypothetical protein [Neorhizobium sp. T25_13]|uniref:hypothetical protein n=1 Tax=Neorhizobium sp. T25_13 TaxID=2093830 RepID=UPI00155EDADD|nr:hypothetical protein [Neorhizobium sp. T25_13]